MLFVRYHMKTYIFRMQDLQVRLISAGFTNIAFRIINSKLAVDGTDGFATLKHKSGDIPVLQEPKDITSSIWQSILDGGIDHILVLDRYKTTFTCQPKASEQL